MCDIIINNKIFKTKSELREYCQGILYKYPLEIRIGREDEDFLRELIKRHPESEQKIGCGIDYFITKANMGSRIFFLYRIDSTSTDFSYLSCITAPSRLTIVKKAGRNTIKEQVMEYKRKNYKEGMVCPVSGLKITSSQMAHVDHKVPLFDDIVTSFIKEKGLNIEDIELEGIGDGEIQKSWKGHIGEEFKVYHEQRAQLQIVHEKVNLSLFTSRKKSPERFSIS